MESDGYMEGMPVEFIQVPGKQGSAIGMEEYNERAVEHFIQDLRTDKKDLSEHKVFKVEEKKPFYNEFEKGERLQKLIKETPNNDELGEIVRREYGV